MLALCEFLMDGQRFLAGLPWRHGKKLALLFFKLIQTQHAKDTSFSSLNILLPGSLYIILSAALPRAVQKLYEPARNVLLLQK